MLAAQDLHKILHSSSLADIISILSIEYEEDLSSLTHSPHHWVIVKDTNTGIIGGLCLTPRSSMPLHPMLAQFCETLKDKHKWVASHLFCWLPQDLDEEDKESLQQAVKSFFVQLYGQLVEFCTSTDISSVWLLASTFQYLSASEVGLLPFEHQLPFVHQGNEYVAALLPTTAQAQQMFIQTQAAYTNLKVSIN